LVKKIFCFDIDETICKTIDQNYLNSTPILERVRKINALFEDGNIIKLYTARGSKTGIDWTEITVKQLSDWGVKYHELNLGKPFADYYIDDKAISDTDFDWRIN
jgi:hypothetical protein